MSKNEITGDNLKTKPASTLYREGWDAIFGKSKVKLGEDEIEHNLDKPYENCSICINRGRISGLSQETCCSRCTRQEFWKKDYYKPVG